jgi:hypothetical protein
MPGYMLAAMFSHQKKAFKKKKEKGLLSMSVPHPHPNQMKA